MRELHRGRYAAVQRKEPVGRLELHRLSLLSPNLPGGPHALTQGILVGGNLLLGQEHG